MTGERNDQPSMEELLASIRRTIAESQIEPAAAADIKPARALAPAAIGDELDDFELPAMFRKGKEDASARSSGFVERLTQAIRGEPASLPDAVAPPSATAPPVPAGSSHSAFAKPSGPPDQSDAPSADASWLVLPLMKPSENAFSVPAAPERNSDPLSLAEHFSAGEMRRVMAPCRDTLIARMGQPVDAPALTVRPRQGGAPVSEAEDFY